MSKRHFIDKINDTPSKTMKNANCAVNVGAKVKMPYVLHDVHLIQIKRHCILLNTRMLSHAVSKLVDEKNSVQ